MWLNLFFWLMEAIVIEGMHFNRLDHYPQPHISGSPDREEITLDRGCHQPKPKKVSRQTEGRPDSAPIEGVRMEDEFESWMDVVGSLSLDEVSAGPVAAVSDHSIRDELVDKESTDELGEDSQSTKSCPPSPSIEDSSTKVTRGNRSEDFSSTPVGEVVRNKSKKRKTISLSSLGEQSSVTKNQKLVHQQIDSASSPSQPDLEAASSDSGISKDAGYHRKKTSTKSRTHPVEAPLSKLSPRRSVKILNRGPYKAQEKPEIPSLAGGNLEEEIQENTMPIRISFLPIKDIRDVSSSSSRPKRKKKSYQDPFTEIKRKKQSYQDLFTNVSGHKNNPKTGDKGISQGLKLDVPSQIQTNFGKGKSKKGVNINYNKAHEMCAFPIEDESLKLQPFDWEIFNTYKIPMMKNADEKSIARHKMFLNSVNKQIENGLGKTNRILQVPEKEILQFLPGAYTWEFHRKVSGGEHPMTQEMLYKDALLRGRLLTSVVGKLMKDSNFEQKMYTDQILSEEPVFMKYLYHYLSQKSGYIFAKRVVQHLNEVLPVYIFLVEMLTQIVQEPPDTLKVNTGWKVNEAWNCLKNLVFETLFQGELKTVQNQTIFSKSKFNETFIKAVTGSWGSRRSLNLAWQLVALWLSKCRPELFGGIVSYQVCQNHWTIRKNLKCRFNDILMYTADILMNNCKGADHQS